MRTAKSLPLQISEVPNLLDRRKHPARSGQARAIGVKFMELLVEVSGHRGESAQELRAFCRVEPGVLHTSPGGECVALH